MRTLSVALFVALGFWLLSLAGPEEGATTDTPQGPTVDLEVFTREGCPRCAAAQPFLQDLQRARPDIRIRLYDVGKDPAALLRLQKLARQHHQAHALGVPAFFVHDTLIIGYLSADTTGAHIQAVLDKSLSPLGDTAGAGVCTAEATTPCDQETAEPVMDAETITTSLFGRISVHELGLPVFTLIIGLLDGFNPCAMWVLLFLLSLLVNLRDRLKMVLIGGTFIIVSGVVYFAFMAAWLNVFLLVGLSRPIQMTLGGIALLIGAINVKDFFALGHGVSLSIPAAAKPGLYARVRQILQAEHLAGALAGVIVLAVLVNTIELLCTAGFPAMYTRILTLRQLPWWEYYAYLGLYNVAYMLDDSLMLGLAVITLGRRKLQEREGRWLKLLSGIVMLGLGGLLLVQPAWLIG